MAPKSQTTLKIDLQRQLEDSALKDQRLQQAQKDFAPIIVPNYTQGAFTESQKAILTSPAMKAEYEKQKAEVEANPYAIKRSPLVEAERDLQQSRQEEYTKAKAGAIDDLVYLRTNEMAGVAPEDIDATLNTYLSEKYPELTKEEKQIVM